MKAKKYVFKWYKKRDRRRADRLSISANGVLHLGRVLREKLPDRIQIGFDPDQRTLAVMEGHEDGFSWPRSGAFTLEDLPAELMDLGLKLPLSFRLHYDSAGACWRGKPYPRRVVQIDTQRERQYDIEQLMAIYPDIIPDAVARIAKTTPLAERRAIATEAFCRAARSYRSCYGELENYLTAQVQACLTQENRQYVCTSRDCSLDQPIGSTEDDFCLYDLLSGDDSGGITSTEDRIMQEQFRAQLSQEGQDLLLMLESGCSFEQIKKCLHLDEPGIHRLGAELGKKWREFSNEV